jgi:hypothetical protein
MKVHIIGIPSAGKTTLASELADRLDAPCYALDGLAFVDENWTLRPTSERDAMLADILDQPAFVTEGGFLGWTERLLAASDVVVWLDPPLPTLVWRHIVRFRHHPSQLPSLLSFQIRSYVLPVGAGPAKDNPNQTRAGIEAALRPWRAKVFRVGRRVSADELVCALRSSPKDG